MRTNPIPQQRKRPATLPTTSCSSAPFAQEYEKTHQMVPVTAGTLNPQELLNLPRLSCHSDLMHITRKTNQELVVVDSLAVCRATCVCGLRRLHLPRSGTVAVVSLAWHSCFSLHFFSGGKKQ
jgi:hypothetical protein